jgi:hypothetical protein
MAKVKIQGNASGAGIFTITPPATATDRTLTLPDATGTLINTAPSTSGYVLTSDGTNWTSAAAAGGLYASVAIIADQKAASVDGGTFTSGAWRTRDLNTEVSDTDGIVSISSNQFTLASGTYTIKWYAVSWRVGRSKTRLYNSSDSSAIQYGTMLFDDIDKGTTTGTGSAIVTIASTKVFEIQHYSQTTKATSGFGTAGNFDTGSTNEVYVVVEIHKHA